MTMLLDEAFIPDDVHTAILELQLSVMSVSEKAIAGASVPELISLAKDMEETQVNEDLKALKGVVNEHLRGMAKSRSRVYDSLKGLAHHL